MDKDLFLGKMYSEGFRQNTLAPLVPMSKNTLSKKINNRVPFNTIEVDRLCELLHITSDVEKVCIFLSNGSQ